MSTYIDTAVVPNPRGGADLQDGHCWWDFTLARLDWLYGEGRELTPRALEDIAAWNSLGQRDAA